VPSEISNGDGSSKGKGSREGGKGRRRSVREGPVHAGTGKTLKGEILSRSQNLGSYWRSWRKETDYTKRRGEAEQRRKGDVARSPLLKGRKNEREVQDFRGLTGGGRERVT